MFAEVEVVQVVLAQEGVHLSLLELIYFQVEVGHEVGVRFETEEEGVQNLHHYSLDIAVQQSFHGIPDFQLNEGLDEHFLQDSLRLPVLSADVVYVEHHLHVANGSGEVLSDRDDGKLLGTLHLQVVPESLLEELEFQVEVLE